MKVFVWATAGMLVGFVIFFVARAISYEKQRRQIRASLIPTPTGKKEFGYGYFAQEGIFIWKSIKCGFLAIIAMIGLTLIFTIINTPLE